MFVPINCCQKLNLQLFVFVDVKWSFLFVTVNLLRYCVLLFLFKYLISRRSVHLEAKHYCEVELRKLSRLLLVWGRWRSETYSIQHCCPLLFFADLRIWELFLSLLRDVALETLFITYLIIISFIYYVSFFTWYLRPTLEMRTHHYWQVATLLASAARWKMLIPQLCPKHSPKRYHIPPKQVKHSFYLYNLTYTSYIIYHIPK